MDTGMDPTGRDATSQVPQPAVLGAGLLAAMATSINPEMTVRDQTLAAERAHRLASALVTRQRRVHEAPARR